MSQRFLYKKDPHLDRLLAEELPCPFCLKTHNITDADWDGEDTFFAYAKCPEVGEIRYKIEYQDKFKRVSKNSVQFRGSEKQ